MNREQTAKELMKGHDNITKNISKVADEVVLGIVKNLLMSERISLEKEWNRTKELITEIKGCEECDICERVINENLTDCEKGLKVLKDE